MFKYGLNMSEKMGSVTLSSHKFLVGFTQAGSGA